MYTIKGCCCFPPLPLAYSWGSFRVSVGNAAETLFTQRNTQVIPWMFYFGWQCSEVSAVQWWVLYIRKGWDILLKVHRFLLHFVLTKYVYIYNIIQKDTEFLFLCLTMFFTYWPQTTAFVVIFRALYTCGLATKDQCKTVGQSTKVMKMTILFVFNIFKNYTDDCSFLAPLPELPRLERERDYHWSY